MVLVNSWRPRPQLLMLQQRFQHGIGVSKRQREVPFVVKERRTTSGYERREAPSHLDRDSAVLFTVPEVTGYANGREIEAPWLGKKPEFM